MYDAIVIGAGPAGGMAALRLARGGAKVLLLEKHKLPRHKACGGGITAPAMEVVDWDISSVVEAIALSSKWQIDFARTVFREHRQQFMMVSRRRFDMHVVERALETGSVTLRDEVPVSHVEEDANVVTAVTKGGERCTARHLVGADGAAGRTAAALGLRRRTRPGIAIDADVEVPLSVWERESRRTSINFGCVRNGYGWIFPKDGYLSCGVGSWSGDVGLPPALDAYMAGALPLGSVLSQVRRGHPIPLYDGPQRLSTERVCLVGDAASLVDPIMGEGIRFALQSGAIAAEIILDRLAGRGIGDSEEYTRRIHSTIGAEFERLRQFILPIFLKSPSAFFTSFFERGQSYSALARALDNRFAHGSLAGAGADLRA